MTRSHRFTAEQVVAFLAGRLTQLRVPVNPQPSNYVPTPNVHPTTRTAPYFDAYCNEPKTELNPRGMSDHWCWWSPDNRQGPDWIRSPFGKPGDTLWGKETFTRDHADFYPNFPIVYRADFGPEYERNEKGEVYSPEQKAWYPFRWQPSSRMKQADSRISATVRRVWVERVQEISEADAVACGAQCAGWPASLTDRGAFGRWWMKRYGPDAWNANGFVWACEIERKPEGMR